MMGKDKRPAGLAGPGRALCGCRKDCGSPFGLYLASVEPELGRQYLLWEFQNGQADEG